MSRFNSIGVFGRKNTNRNSLDPKISGATISIPIVASGAAQNTGVFFNPGVVISAFINVKTPEVTGTTKTVSIGFAGGSGAEVINAADVSSTSVAGQSLNPLIQLSDELTYTLGSADFAELEAELVLTVLLLNN